MSAFTPGPWRAGHYSSVVGLPVTAQPDPKENTIVICGVLGTREEAEANAHLIAAAPELYEALEAVRQNFDGRQHPPTVGLVNAALAKARGEQP